MTESEIGDHHNGARETCAENDRPDPARRNKPNDGAVETDTDKNQKGQWYDEKEDIPDARLKQKVPAVQTKAHRQNETGNNQDCIR